MSKIALVFGATGLVGGNLVQELIKDPEYHQVKVFGRGEYSVPDPKVEYHRIDFDKPDEYSAWLTGDDLFICLGTTIKKAGSVAAMERIDRDYPVTIARLAFANGTGHIAVVSSMGANKKSRNYYLRIKGEMEEGICNTGFSKTVIVRPSLLMGKRKEFRFGEMIAKGMVSIYKRKCSSTRNDTPA
jgi:uncharacterized protein YbjT (DUF2867 family)